MTKTTYDRTCEHCGAAFQAQRRSARFCSEAHRKAAARDRAKESRPPAPPAWSRADVLVELGAMLELLPRDIELLEELIGGLETHRLGLLALRRWIAEEAP